jgi:hypothetical protein
MIYQFRSVFCVPWILLTGCDPEKARQCTFVCGSSLLARLFSERTAAGVVRATLSNIGVELVPVISPGEPPVRREVKAAKSSIKRLNHRLR